ncbi:carbonic anhydrase [Microbaculum marinisediminis]|uniref:carbonic anhydrase n=1 Tax=Microbaculum marinisediminis TaxID=2931392 RepID=A0AAW5R1A0_9HYPH|nr:carbonic anhydrase [Microbaculum sp. A6E488]MCT8972448.1 carbonic anhydrase [Microbaculum sp. A6E488]
MCEKCATTGRTSLSRRGFVTGIAGLAAASMALPGLAMAEESGTPQNAISPSDALKRLLEGNERYASNKAEPRDNSAGRAARTLGQHPIAAILSCADSRVAPELAFDQGPGDLFVVRVAGNIVSPDGLASLEFGVKFLSTPLVMVLGHTSCGAVNAAISTVRDDAVLPGHLPGLINGIEPAVIAAKANDPKDLLAEATKENVRLTQKALVKGSAIIAEAADAGRIEIVGGVYDLATGRVAML